MPILQSKLSGNFDPNIFIFDNVNNYWTIKDGGINFDKLSVDARIKYKIARGGPVDVGPNSTTTIASITVNAGEFKSWYVLIANVSGASTPQMYHDRVTEFKVYLYKNNTLLLTRSLSGNYSASTTLPQSLPYAGGGPTMIYVETNVDVSATYYIKVENWHSLTLNDVASDILIIGQ